MVHFFHEGGGPYLKGEKPPTPSSISNTRLIDGVPPLSANGPLRFIRIIYMGQAHKSNITLQKQFVVGGQETYRHTATLLYVSYADHVNHAELETEQINLDEKN